jgi:nucleoid-associated protein YgaU
LSFEILLDETDSPTGNVIKDVELLYSCCTPTPESRAAGRPSPPIVLFGWGHTMSFHAFVKSVSGTYEFFGPDGTVKAWKGSVELEEFPVGNPGTNPTSGGPPSRKTHVVTAGDSLANIAYREYGNPNLWRAVASANRIDDPMRLPPGTRLFIPGAAEASATV